MIGGQGTGFPDMLGHGVQIAVHQLVILVGKGIEVAVLTLAAAEGNMNIKTQSGLVGTLDQNRHQITSTTVNLRPVSGQP